MDLSEHLQRARHAAEGRRIGATVTAVLGGLLVLLGFFGGVALFFVVGAVLGIVGLIGAGVARRRVEDIDTQILRGP